MTTLSFWGLCASPYQLKMQSLADYAEVPWRRFPDQARTASAIAMLVRLRHARARGHVERFPQFAPGMDEYPEVPYYCLGDQFYYDSTGLALHLDSLQLPPNSLMPPEEAIGFLCRLIDEAFDEFGLYMVHHQRWMTSAQTNVMAERTVAELSGVLPLFTRNAMKKKLARRQVRRCPYLFSVAPAGYECGMPVPLTPPSQEGFPQTHTLLDSAWRRYLAALEHLLGHQPFILGQRFTLADASVYGQLGMNLTDGRAAELLQELAPRTFQWLNMIDNGDHRGSTGDLIASAELTPLLQCIAETFIPLMQQNEAAYEHALTQGQQLFNEEAFDRGEALYDGHLMGMPFRAVAKTFQVATWRELCEQWRALGDGTRERVMSQFPMVGEALFASIGSAPGH